MNRRDALVAVTALVGFFNGTPARAAQGGRSLLMPLDGIDVISIRLRGQEVNIAPQELIDALKGAAHRY